jgi:predicted phosphoribosyltransferase
MFKDRKDAGKQLARALESYRDRDGLVLAIPRGGVEVGYEVARDLKADFSFLVARKLPFPERPEAGFGAVAEDGSAVILEEASRSISEETIQHIIQEQHKETERRIAVLRQNKSLPEMEDRTVILVDDGIAMGSTMRAAIRCCKNQEVGEIVVAVPVAGAEVKKQIQERVDDLIVLETPVFFRAVAQGYHDWHDVSDREVIAILRQWQDEHDGLAT